MEFAPMATRCASEWLSQAVRIPLCNESGPREDFSLGVRGMWNLHGLRDTLGRQRRERSTGTQFTKSERRPLLEGSHERSCVVFTDSSPVAAVCDHVGDVW